MQGNREDNNDKILTIKIIVYIISTIISICFAVALLVSITKDSKKAEQISVQINIEEQTKQESQKVEKKIEIENPEHLLASLEEENIFLYFDTSPEENSYQGAYIKTDSNISYYDWDFYADMYWMPELTLLHNNQHLLVQFVDGHGTGVLISRAYMIDLATMKEILIQSPFEILDTHLQVDEFNHETGTLCFHYLDETVALEIDADVFDIMAFDSIGYESFFRYEVKDDTLFFWTTLQVSSSFFLNDMTITYKFENEEYQFDTMYYIQE